MDELPTVQGKNPSSLLHTYSQVAQPQVAQALCDDPGSCRCAADRGRFESVRVRVLVIHLFGNTIWQCDSNSMREMHCLSKSKVPSHFYYLLSKCEIVRQQ
jgi:hypothetical protein